MPDFLLQLGHCPDLSHAEILAVQNRFPLDVQFIQRLGETVRVHSTSHETIREFCLELGGTIRALEVVSRQACDEPGNLLPPAEQIIELVCASLDQSALYGREKKVVFGLTVINKILPGKKARVIHALLSQTALGVKNHLKQKGVSSRYILPDPQGDSFCLNGAQVEKNKILQEGIEIGLFLTPSNELWIGHTLWLQGYEKYSQRDYGRPCRDIQSGMLPPKLARMLINLSRQRESYTLLDPFCGSGGIVTEAGIMGFQATGLDNSAKAVQATQENWKWLNNHSKSKIGTVRVLEGDARSLHTLCEPLYFDACATEPYLGPPLRNPMQPTQFEKLSKQLVPLYLRALGEIRTVVKPGARVVFIVPRFRLYDKEECVALPILSELKLQGYSLLDPLAGFTPTKARTTLHYSRPQQFVQREIFVLQA